MNKEKMVFWSTAIAILLSTTVGLIGVYLYIQRGNSICAATADFQNTERNLWLNIAREFGDPTDPDSDRFLIFIDRELPEVECRQGKLTTVGEQ